jgi:hypothetical protein
MSTVERINPPLALHSENAPSFFARVSVTLDCGCGFWMGKDMDNEEVDVLGGKACEDAHDDLMHDAGKRVEQRVPIDRSRLELILADALDGAESDFKHRSP